MIGLRIPRWRWREVLFYVVVAFLVVLGTYKAWGYATRWSCGCEERIDELERRHRQLVIWSSEVEAALSAQSPHRHSYIDRSAQCGRGVVD